MVLEQYRLTLSHYIIDDDGIKHNIDDPIIIEHAFDRRFNGSPIILNRMIDQMKDYVLNKIEMS